MEQKDDILYYDSANFRVLKASSHQTADLYLTTCGIEHCTSSKEITGLVRTEWLIHFILEGKGTYRFHNQTYNLEKGTAFLIPPHQSDYSYVADSHNPWKYMWIGFNGRKVESYITHTDLSVSNPTCRLHIPLEDFYSLIQDLLRTKQLTLSNELKRVSYIYKMFSLLATSYINAHPKSVIHDYSSCTYALYAKEYLSNNYTHTNITSLAAQIGIDRSYLHNIFKNFFGISPQEYLIHCRLDAAAKLLSTTEIPIKEISSECGYENSLQFSKLFKKHYQVSPSEYRIIHFQKGTDLP